MLLEFELWLKENTNYNVVINKNELSDSLVIDIDDDNNIARFTAWDDNSCMLEIIDIDNDGYIINERYDISNLQELTDLFNKFKKLLK
ncbi:hypothetical protein N5923_22900 [Erwiniaceae bacterium BAC15a-03b]|uniref:Uncharacterized protein n=1 Tax=Winslowiella arboricola TaxID=2978220 RepID=A0A9J6PZK8_9GAMM|nr:hypothetical protein [Winslowiella arboricola]MCU5775255.1 hypothetical protein [Winslowiella arboricola]MCU5780348.1 hypothetical protein [Winslowiella arboricola]